MEQYMMYRKAMLFNDLEIAEKILSTNDVAKIKGLGRKVRGFSDTVWNEYKVEIVIFGLYCKFSCNPELMKKLLNTGETILAECAVRDIVCGIGLSMRDSRRFNQECWRGSNLLGMCLMDVRSRLRCENF